MLYTWPRGQQNKQPPAEDERWTRAHLKGGQSPGPVVSQLRWALLVLQTLSFLWASVSSSVKWAPTILTSQAAERIKGDERFTVRKTSGCG